MFSGLMAEANIDLLNRLFMPTDCTDALTLNWPSHYPPPPTPPILLFFFSGVRVKVEERIVSKGATTLPNYIMNE